MARKSWLDETTSLPTLDKQVEKLEHFVDALADGVIDSDELAAQEKKVVAAMKAAEKLLGDDEHKAVTKLLVELTAYNVMHVLHDMAKAKVEKAFS